MSAKYLPAVALVMEVVVLEALKAILLLFSPQENLFLCIMGTYVNLVLLLPLLAQRAFGAKILALMAVVSHSHHLWNTEYLEELVNRGHHVTYFGVDEYKNRPKNINHILVEGVHEFVSKEIDLTSVSDISSYQSVMLFSEWDKSVAQFITESEAMKKLVKLVKNEKFDLIVHDIGHGEYLLGAVDVLGRPPVVGITAFGVPTWALQILGNPMAYSSKPCFNLPYSTNMTFLERANNYFLHLFSFAVRWLHIRHNDELSKRYFGRNVRPLDKILDDINIIMVNSNHGTDPEFPKVSGLIPVGGLHIQKPKPLNQELKTFLDEAKDGVIYFSLGTNINSTLTKEKIGTLMEAFDELAPVQILWKLDLDDLQGKPKNVKIKKWLPQNDILAHPNVRLFFTHSGLLSTQEAVYHGKPIVGMPFFLDQFSNLQKCVERGFAEKLEYNTLKVKDIVSTIRKVLNDPRYEENVKKASVIFRDEADHPLHRAIYWTEYAIRHKGAPHLRHSARNLSWYQNWMLDVFILTTGSAFIASLTTYKLMSAVMHKICYIQNRVFKIKKN